MLTSSRLRGRRIQTSELLKRIRGEINTNLEKQKDRSSQQQRQESLLGIIGRFNLLVSQSFLYICVEQFTIVMVGLQYKSMTTIFSIWYINTNQPIEHKIEKIVCAT